MTLEEQIELLTEKNAELTKRLTDAENHINSLLYTNNMRSGTTNMQRLPLNGGPAKRSYPVDRSIAAHSR